MRMWSIDPKLMCRKHLLGEHVEMHMFVGTLNKGTSIKGYIEKGFVNPSEITLRHDQLAKEMRRRKYKHNSDLNFSSHGLDIIPVNTTVSSLDLRSRCTECKNNGV